MATVIVANSTQLQTALAAAVGGDLIQLKTGNYGDVTIARENYASNVTITSYSNSARAVFNTLNIYSSSNLTISNIDDTYVPTASSYAWSPMVFVNQSSNVSLMGMNVTGGNSINGVDPSATALDASGNVLGLPVGYGISVNHASNVSIVNDQVYNIGKGLVLLNSTGLTVSSNNIHDTRTSLISGANISNVLIANNQLGAAHPWRWGQTPIGDHADFIHIWTTPSNQTTASSNITITNNILNQGAGVAILGIYLDDGGGSNKLGFTNVNISNNTILNGELQGVRAEDLVNSKITSNALIQSSGVMNDAPGILLRNVSSNNTISNNVLKFFSDLTANPTNVLTGNVFGQEWDSNSPNYYTTSWAANLATYTAPSSANTTALNYFGLSPNTSQALTMSLGTAATALQTPLSPTPGATGPSLIGPAALNPSTSVPLMTPGLLAAISAELAVDASETLIMNQFPPSPTAANLTAVAGATSAAPLAATAPSYVSGFDWSALLAGHGVGGSTPTATTASSGNSFAALAAFSDAISSFTPVPAALTPMATPTLATPQPLLAAPVSLGFIPSSPSSFSSLGGLY